MYIDDITLGTIELVPNARARRIIVRHQDGAFRLTHPTSASRKEILETIEEMKPRLKEMKNKVIPQFLFTEETLFETLTLRVVIKQTALSNIYVNTGDGVLTITYPQTMSLESKKMQSYVRQIIEQSCRAEANKVLPQKVRDLAAQHNFEVGDIKINKSRGRWGSCSTKRNINLSYFCMMLPKHLVDFIILHELCHTREMNHGPRFWALLDSVSGNRAQALTRELKNVKLKW